MFDRLFDQTRDYFSPFILIHLVGTMAFLACCIFEMDLVIYFIFQFSYYFTKKKPVFHSIYYFGRQFKMQPLTFV